MVTLLALLLHVLPAQGGVFEHKTAHGDWSSRQVEQELVLPKGWFQLELAADHKSTGRYRDSDGAAVDWGDGTTWRYSRLWLNLDQGFSPRATIYLRVPFVWAHLSNDRGASTGTLAMGDVHTGIRWQPWLERAWALGIRLDLKAQSGVEWPRDFIGGPDNVQGFLTGTGITNLGAHVQARYRFGRTLKLQAECGYIRKFPGIVGYIVETDGFGNGWLKPADEIAASLDVQLQIVDGLAVAVQPTFSHRRWYGIGVSGAGHKLDDAEFFYPVAPSSWLDLGGRIDLDPGARWGLTAEASAQLLGGESTTFAALGLEEYQPQPGLTLGLRGRVKW